MIFNTGDPEVLNLRGESVLSPEIWAGYSAHHLGIVFRMAEAYVQPGEVYQVSYIIKDGELGQTLPTLLSRYVEPAMRTILEMIVADEYETSKEIEIVGGAKSAMLTVDSFNVHVLFQYDRLSAGIRVIFTVS